MNKRLQHSRPGARPGLIGLVIACVLLGGFTGCTDLNDWIRNWGMRQRDRRVKGMTKGQHIQWQRDFNLSKAKARALQQTAEGIVQESRLQGRLAWKLGRAYCFQGRFEVGRRHMQAALERKPLGKVPLGSGTNLFEKSLPYLQQALLHSPIDKELLFDAGLCYANASRALGWEEDRFRSATFLFERLRVVDPRDTRASYQLALLYGKTPNRKLRQPERAIKLLKSVILKDEFNIPARFALGNILTETGKFPDAMRQYGLIQEKLSDLHKRGNLPGNVSRNPKFIQARKNQDRLRVCIQGKRGCDIARPRL